MDINLRSRFDHFLAKAAGVEVNLDSINPPVPTNQTEELLMKLNERIGSGGGGSNVMVVNFESDEDMTTISTTEKYSDADAALKSGGYLVACVNSTIEATGGKTKMYFPCMGFAFGQLETGDEGGYIMFTLSSRNVNATITWMSNGACIISSDTQ